ncbi:MAG: LpxI family protein, partial [Rhodospirillaceae bacterium]|nr:LpxI family protein [Rhodospirillaceae bacterium]
MPPKLGILAGGGELPSRLVEHCRNTGREVFVIAFEGQTLHESVQSVDHQWVRLGAAGTSLKALKSAGVKELVMAGAIRRPSLGELRPDMWATKFFAKSGAASLGDDGLLSAIVKLLEQEGFSVVGIDDVLPDTL